MMPDAVVTCWHFSVPTNDQPAKRYHAMVPAAVEDLALKYLCGAAAALGGDPAWFSHDRIRRHGGWVIDGVRYHCRPRVDRIITWWAA